MADEVYAGNPIAALSEALDGGLAAGRVGVIVARPGTGKSALAVHLALGALLADDSVLHVVIGESVDHARAHYDSVFAAIARRARGRDWSTAQLKAERRRMILSYKSLDLEHVRAGVNMLRGAADFAPKLAVVEGLDAPTFAGAIEGLVALAGELGCPLWVTVTSEEALEAAALAHAALELNLEPEGRLVNLSLAHGVGRAEQLTVALDPKSMLVLGFDRQPTDPADGASRPQECSLFSGGARGSEETFGVAAERWGVREVHFTFEGHKQARTVGTQQLGERELAAGDVSLVYVSKRLNRTYNTEGSLIRRVLQTLWHMVSRSQQVFVVGAIQEDGTVTGGTGWSVELARMWNKDLWVYDQEQVAWFQWDGSAWAAGEPIIRTIHFCGTGTRYLTDDGRSAIVDLFERSFGTPLD
ncbi:MAG: hypothetical protein ACI8PZ_000124 [Myxococcota bacterium]|jgi:hypothetical protein